MALIASQTIDADGAAVTTAAADAGGDTFANPTERTIFRVVNAAGTTRTVTFTATQPCNQGVTHDVVQVTNNGESWDFGPFDKGRFNDGAGLVSVTYDVETGLTVAAIEVTKAP